MLELASYYPRVHLAFEKRALWVIVLNSENFAANESVQIFAVHSIVVVADFGVSCSNFAKRRHRFATVEGHNDKH
jgi:hypothetical protein